METILIVNSILLWIVVLFNLLLTLALIRKLNTAGNIQNGLTPGTKAPDFIAQRLSGENVSLADYLGHRVVFLFISPHCKPCKVNFPSFHAVYPDAKRAGVEMILVSTMDPDGTREMVKEYQMEIPVLLAPQDTNMFMESYNISGTPAFCFINENGVIEICGYPGLDSEEWRKLIESWKKESIGGR